MPVSFQTLALIYEFTIGRKLLLRAALVVLLRLALARVSACGRWTCLDLTHVTGRARTNGRTWLFSWTGICSSTLRNALTTG